MTLTLETATKRLVRRQPYNDVKNNDVKKRFLQKSHQTFNHTLNI